MSIDIGGPAFPCEQHETQDNMWNQTFQSGMTLRDYFAAKVLASPLCERLAEMGAAERAYSYADAMIKARRIPK